MSWDWIITVVIIGGLVLAIWARVSRQTVGELIGDIFEKMRGTADNSVEEIREISF